MHVAVLGTGGMGETVIKHLAQCPEVSRIVGFDTQQDRLDQLHQKHGIDTQSDLQKLLSDDNIKLVFVTASNPAHAQLSIAALEAGKAVMCEKPMATTLEDAAAMVETVQRLNGFLQIGFELRYSKLYTTVHDWIQQGLVGDVIHTQCTYICEEFHGKGSWRNQNSSGGMLAEKLSHYIDLPRWWINSPVKEIYSVAAPNAIPYYEVHDNYQATYRYQSGAVSHLTFMMAFAATSDGDPLQDTIQRQADEGHQLRYIVHGTRGAVETDVFGRRICRYEFGESPTRMTSKIVEDLTWSCEEDHHYFHNTLSQTQDIVRRVAAGEPPMTPPQDSLETTRLVFATEQATNTGQVVKLG